MPAICKSIDSQIQNCCGEEKFLMKNPPEMMAKASGISVGR